jgi:F-type H+-transporting ATPase subunit epsilon
MATELQLEIVTPESLAFSGMVTQVILPAWDGQEGVYPEHDAKLALLRGGVCTVFTAEGQVHYAVGRGFAEIGGSHVTLLTDSCELAADIDKAQAAAEKTEATASLAAADWTSEQAEALRARIEVAEARTQA